MLLPNKMKPKTQTKLFSHLQQKGYAESHHSLLILKADDLLVRPLHQVQMRSLEVWYFMEENAN